MDQVTGVHRKQCETLTELDLESLLDDAYVPETLFAIRRC